MIDNISRDEKVYNHNYKKDFEIYHSLNTSTYSFWNNKNDIYSSAVTSGPIHIPCGSSTLATNKTYTTVKMAIGQIASHQHAI